MRIEKLNSARLSDAIELRDCIFDELLPLEYETLEASLDTKKFSEWYAQAQMKTLDYWVALNEVENLLGLIGLYTEQGDKKSKVWLGWFCVDSNYRGKKVGSRLLDFAIDTAKAAGFGELHLYTTYDNEYKQARFLYEKRGFVKYKELKKDGSVYFKLTLN
mgnify:CR=1 FL=1